MKINREDFDKFIEVFLIQNSKLNLVSKNDEKFLWEKHIYDSLAIENVFIKYPDFKPETMLDIGTGGGFPSIPAAIAHPEITVYALDSIRKKVNAIDEIKSALNLENLIAVCDRAENIKQKFDLITSRAVAPLKVITGYALPLLKRSGIFAAYKSRKTNDEIAEAAKILKKFNAKIIDIIEYKLPLEENYSRNLIIIEKL